MLRIVERCQAQGGSGGGGGGGGGPWFLEFWATWCARCVDSVPHLNELASKFKSLRFISITDERPDVVEKFLAEHPIEGLAALDDDGEIPQDFR